MDFSVNKKNRFNHLHQYNAYYNERLHEKKEKINTVNSYKPSQTSENMSWKKSYVSTKINHKDGLTTKSSSFENKTSAYKSADVMTKSSIDNQSKKLYNVSNCLAQNSSNDSNLTTKSSTKNNEKDTENKKDKNISNKLFSNFKISNLIDQASGQVETEKNFDEKQNDTKEEKTSDDRVFYCTKDSRLKEHKPWIHTNFSHPHAQLQHRNNFVFHPYFFSNFIRKHQMLLKEMQKIHKQPFSHHQLNLQQFPSTVTASSSENAPFFHFSNEQVGNS